MERRQSGGIGGLVQCGLGGDEEIGGIIARERGKRSFVWAKWGQFAVNW
jgi:hypothetical protein